LEGDFNGDLLTIILEIERHARAVSVASANTTRPEDLVQSLEAPAGIGAQEFGGEWRVQSRPLVGGQ
jgi:hypothetical protein